MHGSTFRFHGTRGIVQTASEPFAFLTSSLPSSSSLRKLLLSDDRLLFAVLLTCRIFCVCLTAIQTSKEHEVDEGFADVIEKGWLIKEGANDDSRRKRQVVNLRHIKLVITPRSGKTREKQNILTSQPCLRTPMQTRLSVNQIACTISDVL